MTTFPPSINKVPGKSDAEVEEERILSGLHRLVAGLTTRREVEHEENVQMLLAAYYTAQSILRRKRKDGTATPASVAKQLRDIQTASETLLRRLKDADKNVFDAWAGPTFEDRQNGTQEWLQLKSLLKESSARGRNAAKVVSDVLKLSEMKGKRGRPDGFLADVIANTAKQVFETTTERKAVRSVSRDDGQPQGEFNNFLRDIFEILGVEASADAANRKMQKK